MSLRFTLFTEAMDRLVLYMDTYGEDSPLYAETKDLYLRMERLHKRRAKLNEYVRRYRGKLRQVK